MIFASWTFASFFAVVFTLYWLISRYRQLQNGVLLISSMYFYGWLHFTFPLYLLALIAVGYFFAIGISKKERPSPRKRTLVAGICIAASLLFYLKYIPFLLSGINSIAHGAPGASVLNILVPVGISFYTLSTIGYLTDVFRRKVAPEENFITYAAYISFFPHLLAGPIPTATKVLPQFREHSFLSWDKIEQSAAEILWGLFKKLVVADNLSRAVEYCFRNYERLEGSTLLVGVTLFSFQIYADFSGYSDIARGLARLLGIDLVQNFRLPFFSRNPREYWQRWHTSLRKWLIDYIYIPMGGNKGGQAHYIIVLLFTFAFSGIWHEATWTFLCWGLINGVLFLPYIFSGTLKRYDDQPAMGKLFPGLKTAFHIFLTFNLVNLTRVFFRSPDIATAEAYYRRLFSASLFTVPVAFVSQYLKWCLPLLLIEWAQRGEEFVGRIPSKNWLIRFAGFVLLTCCIVAFSRKTDFREYYYFKF